VAAPGVLRASPPGVEAAACGPRRRDGWTWALTPARAAATLSATLPPPGGSGERGSGGARGPRAGGAAAGREGGPVAGPPGIGTPGPPRRRGGRDGVGGPAPLVEAAPQVVVVGRISQVCQGEVGC
jgi:hypothetical protein